MDLFSDQNCRMSFRPQSKTISLFAHNFNIQSKQVNIKCDPMGFKINGYVLNPLIYTACRTGLDKESYRDLTIHATARMWNDSMVTPGYSREDIFFKPFFPIKDNQVEKELEATNGWSLDD